MIDFEKIIAEAQKSGVSLEDLRQDFTRAFDEAQNAQSIETERDQYIDDIWEQLEYMVNEDVNDPTYGDVAALLTLVAACSEKGKNWNVHDLDTFRENVTKQLPILVNAFAAGITFGDKLTNLADKYFSIDVNNRKDKEKPDIKVKGNIDIAEAEKIVSDFLRQLGL